MNKKDMIEAVAEAIYNTMPLQEERRIPTTVVSPAYEKIIYDFTWEECKVEAKDYASHFYVRAKVAIKAFCGKLPALEQPKHGWKVRSDIYTQLKQWGEDE